MYKLIGFFLLFLSYFSGVVASDTDNNSITTLEESSVVNEELLIDNNPLSNAPAEEVSDLTVSPSIETVPDESKQKLVNAIKVIVAFLKEKTDNNESEVETDSSKKAVIDDDCSTFVNLAYRFIVFLKRIELLKLFTTLAKSKSLIEKEYFGTDSKIQLPVYDEIFDLDVESIISGLKYFSSCPSEYEGGLSENTVNYLYELLDTDF